MVKKFHNHNSKGNFRFLLGVFDIESNEQIFFGKNLDMNAFDLSVKNIKKKLK